MDWNYTFEYKEEEESNWDFKEYVERSGLIFLIEACPNLWTSMVDGDTNQTWLRAVLSSCLAVIKNKAITNNKDGVSLVFFGTNKTTDSMMKSVYVYQNLEPPTVESIKKLMELETISLKKFEEDFGINEKETSLYYALWSCQTLFAKSTIKLTEKKIMLFTSNDDPCKTNAVKKKSLLIKSRDLRQAGIQLELIPIAISSSTSGAFDIDSFYKKFVSANRNELDCDNSIKIDDPINAIDQLKIRTRHKIVTKRALARLQLFLGDGSNGKPVSLGVGVYSLVRKSAAVGCVKLDRASNVELVSQRVFVLKANDQLLQPFDMRRGVEINGRTICFEKEELQSMRSVIMPGLHLVGFKPQRLLKNHYQIRPAQFIYPDDSCVAGSRSIFSALLIRCAARNLFALCAFLSRAGAALHMAALVPQLEKADSKGKQILPPGFHVVFLPFADDLRSANCPEVPPANEEDKAVCRELIEAVSVEFEPESILNPALQKKMAVIEAMALDCENPDTVEDNTLIDSKEINEHCGEVLKKFRDHFHLNFQVNAAAKVPVAVPNFYEMMCLNRLSELTVPQLREEAKKAKITLQAKIKKDIITEINTHYAK